mmetsp:Transcript_37748/g.119930  ORF Transcript_37748/g.119930 Transcript_37748/m.119930 type:complete len:321 (+) Transcript_37748:383-1345(+)
MRRCSSKEQPSKMISCTVTGRGVVEESLNSWGSKEATRCRLSMETASFRAVCCRRAFRNTSARRKLLRSTGFSTGLLEAMRFSQSLFSATMRLARPCRKSVGSSGAAGHPDAQPGGVSDRIKQRASAWMSGVLKTVPLITFCNVVSEVVTLSSRRAASKVSMSTNATMGGSSGETGLISMPLSFAIWDLLTLSHNVNSGFNCCFQALTSTPPAPESPPSMEPEAEANCLSMEIALTELTRCKDLSAFGAMPNDCGLSRSGICSTSARKSDMLVEGGIAKGGMSTLGPPFLRGPSSTSLRKKRERYSRTSLESNSLSTRLP